MYVLLETNQEERFLTEDELRSHLAHLLTERLGVPPQEIPSQVQALLDTACDLPLGVGEYCQWYATRIDRPISRRRTAHF